VIVTLLTCHIPGKPVAKQRPRMTRDGHAYTPAATRQWERYAATLLGHCWHPRDPLDAPVVVEIVVVLPRPKTRPNSLAAHAWMATGCPAIGRSDVDNFAKAGLDAMVKAGVIVDDTRVVDLRARKVYADPGQGPGVVVTMRAWEAA